MLKKWLIVLVTPFVFQLLFLGILLKSQAGRTEAQRMANHSRDVLLNCASLYRGMLESRDLVLSAMVAKDVTRGNFGSNLAKVKTQITYLRELVSDNPMQGMAIDTIDRKASSYLAWLQETDRIAREGFRDQATARFRNTADRVTLEEVNRLIEQFVATETGLETQRNETLAGTIRWQNAIIVVGAIVSLGLAVGLVWTFMQDFGRRMQILAENARRLAEGKVLVNPLSGRDEIAELDGVFHAMARSLQEREQENEMFIYSVSHDLRSPLVNLQGFSRELTYMANDLRKTLGSVEKSPEVDAALQHLLDRDMASAIHFIQNAVSRLSAIIDSLLRLSRAGRVEYRMQSLDMNAMVHRVVEAQKNTTAEKGATIEVQTLQPAWGDATIVEQVFANLLSNAVKYLDPARPGRIEVGQNHEVDDAPGFHLYYVRDNGLGIPEAHQGKLFLAFQRLHPNVAEGEGIGLALVRRMVERHGGRIWAESEAGVGSTFFVTLPIPAETEATDTPNEATTAMATGERR